MERRLGWALAPLLLAAVFFSTRTSADNLTDTTPDLAVRTEDHTSCWEIGGPHELQCFHADPLLLNDYPFTEEMLARSVNRYPTTDLSFHRAFQRARGRGVLKVVVLGGSVTYGHSCVTPGGQYNNECAWPNRLQQWFDERVHDFAVEIVNAATPAYDITDMLHNQLRTTLPFDSDVDLIVVDYGVNDAVVQHYDMDVNNIKRAHEVFIRHVRNSMFHDPALLYVEGIMAPARTRNSPSYGTNLAEVHAAVTQKYDIPMASFRDAVWPDGTDDTLAASIWGLETHPDWQVHQLFADIAAYCIQKSYARFVDEHGTLSEPSDIEESLSEYQSTLGCLADERSFHLDASTFVNHDPPKELLSASNWSFIADVHGTAGMIGFGSSPTEAVVTFELPCPGNKRILDIEYLISYENMGAVQLTVAGVEDEDASVSVVLDGLWTTPASLDMNKVFYLPDEFGPIRLTFEILSPEMEAAYSSVLADGTAVRNGAESRRADRNFKVVRMQCC